MTKQRRRYDTIELVAELKRERRNALLLSLAGIGILIILLTMYVTSIGGDDVPKAPEEESTAASETASPPDSVPAPAVASDTSAKSTVVEEEPAPVATKPATVRLIMPRKAHVWVDGKSLGKLKKKKIELDPGEHQFKAKIGRKIVKETVTPEAAQNYELRVDKKGRKVRFKEIK